MNDFDTFIKIALHVSNLGKIIVALALNPLPKKQKIAQSGHTDAGVRSILCLFVRALLRISSMTHLTHNFASAVDGKSWLQVDEVKQHVSVCAYVICDHEIGPKYFWLLHFNCQGGGLVPCKSPLH